MKGVILKYLCVCEGWKTAIKELHWNSENLSQHKLCDDIADRISDFQDQVGEVEQSISGNLEFNKLKPVPYRVKDLKSFVDDVISSTNAFYKKVKSMGEKYVGMSSDCESFISDMQRNLYLVNFTVKEDFKRNYKKKLNESKNSIMKLKVSKNDFQDALNESIKNVLKKYIVNEACYEAEVKGGEYNDKKLNFTHFAVNKYTNLIVDGWDYSGYDTDDLKANKNDYFYNDLKDNGFNPKAYKILSFKACKRNGLDPNNNVNWSNTGVFPLYHEIEMRKRGEEPFDVAKESHPDWFID